MSSSAHLRTLQEKISKKNSILIQELKNRTDKKIKEFKKTIALSLSKENKDSEILIKKISETIDKRISDESRKLLKIKSKIQKIQKMVDAFNFEAFQSEILEYKKQISKHLKQKALKIEAIQKEQQELMVNDLSKINKTAQKTLEKSIKSEIEN